MSFSTVRITDDRDLAPVDLADPLAPYRHGLILLVGIFVAAGVVSAITLTRRTPAPGADDQS